MEQNQEAGAEGGEDSPEGTQLYDVGGLDGNLVDMISLEDILTSTQCQTWFRLWCDNQVDKEMVLKKWGPEVLETFVISR